MSAPIIDPLRDDDETALEIGFALPERYNASSILFDNLARGNGARAALHTRRGATTYAMLCEQAARYAQAFSSAGMQRGDRIMLVLDDTPTYPAAFFGALRAGCVPMLINTQSTPDLIRFYLQDSGARAAVVDADFMPLFDDATIAETALEIIIAADARNPSLGAVKIVGAENFLAPFAGLGEAADTHRNDMAFWMYSSGSTGRPKGVVHLQHDMAYAAQSYARHILKATRNDIFFSVPKIFFAYGLGNTLTFPFAVGASSILLAGRPEPQSIFEHIARHKPTIFFGLPTLYTALAHAPHIADAHLSSIRLYISAAEVLADEIAAAWKALTGREIVEGLGSTEMTHIYLSNSEGEKRAGSAGRRVPGYALKITDSNGAPVAPGQEGVLWIKGHSSAPCYWRRPDKTAETMRGEWLWTGDRFVCDADGFHYFRGRADDLVKVSGQWVYPLEVELCLANHPAVRECAVLAHELEDRRMTLRSFVVLKKEAPPASARQLQDYVKQKLVAYKYPRIVEFMTELPKTGTGKIDRRKLAERPVEGNRQAKPS
ncbi:MAG: benzoate-CoA ligase family protein [Hyphomicrobiales bacterium]|nr:benzoate-CoA ligase family protein [Hyphomicrobiales bacterium]